MRGRLPLLLLCFLVNSIMGSWYYQEVTFTYMPFFNTTMEIRFENTILKSLTLYPFFYVVEQIPHLHNLMYGEMYISFIQRIHKRRRVSNDVYSY